MHRPLVVLLVLGLSAAGCGGPEISHDDLTRDDSGLMARRYHEDVVRLAGDVDSSPDPSVAGVCEAPCANHPRIVQLTDQICSIWERDQIDEATHFLCEDARERQQSSQRRYDTCHCGDS